MGAFDDNSFGGGGAFSKKKSSSASYLKKKKEEWAAKQTNADAQRQASEADKKKQAAKPSGNFLKEAADNVGAVVGGVVKGVTESYKRIGEGTAEVLNEVTGGAQKARDQQSKSNADDIAAIKNYGQKILNAKTDEEKNRYRAALSALVKTSDVQSKDFQERQKQIIERTDPVKGAGAVASVGLDIVTAGTGGALLKGGKAVGEQVIKEGLKQGGKNLLKQTAKNAGVGAGIGGLYGATQTLQDKGSAATFEDFKNNIAAGAGVGAALPIAGGLRKLRPIQAVDKFVSETAKAAGAKVSSQVAKTKVGQAVQRGVEKTKVAFGESLAPVMKDFKGLKDKDGRQINENIRQLDTNVTNSSSITEGRLKENPAWQELADLVKPETNRPGSLRAARKEKDELGKFISAKQDAINSKKLGAKGVEIPVGTPKQEKAYELLNKATKADVQYAFDNNLLTEANYKKYMKDDNYTRVQRDMGETLQNNFKGVGGANGSLSNTIFKQRLRGSKKEALDPFAAHFDWSDKVTREVQRQKLSSYIIEKRQEHGLGKGYLRKAQTVEDRQAAIGEANQLRVLRNGLGKAVKSESKYGKRLEQELNSLSKKGKDLSIKNAGSSKTPRPKARVKAHIDALVKTSTPELTRIRNKVAAREPKLAAHIDNLISLKQSHEVASKAVKEMTDIARKNGDQISTNKTTIKTFTRGIKEIYEDDPRIVDAINKVGRVELHALVKVAQAPSKLVQRTATALNFVFTASNLARDQVSSAILSKNVTATHTPISFLIGLKEAALKPSAKAVLRGVGARGAAESKRLQPTKEYENFLKFVAGSTRTDINRNLKSTARRTNESLGLKKDNIVRKVENINSATENLTRFQNYIGTMRNGIKKGIDPETLQKDAIQAARENSVDFNRSGDWAPFLKIFNPFVNANIQGSRSLARAFSERPVSTAMKIGTTILAPVAASTYYNLGDPQRALIYSQLSESDRTQNLIFITAEGKVLKMPLPPGIREFAAPVRGTIEAEYGSGNPQDFVKTAKSLFVDSVNPFNLSDVVPQFTKPVVEAMSNHSFFTGEAIVPDYLKDKDPSEQVFKGTSQTYRDIASKFGISPLIAKNIITGYTSSVGEQGVSLFDKLRKAGGQDVATDNRDTVSQLKGKFYEAKPDQNSAANRTFFDSYDPIKARKDRVSKEVTSLVQEGKLAQAKRKASEFNQSLPGAFSKFNSSYGSSNKDVTQDPMWDDMMNSLAISTSETAFKARLKQ